MLSILFASHNGETTLPLMLEAFCKLQIPQGGWKIIAVDNASTDNTSEVLHSYSTKLPLEVHFCKERGKNKALNSGIPFIEGDLVVLTDDDILPQPDWLIELEKSANAHPGFDIFGGAITAHWSISPPLWLTNSTAINMSIIYAVTPKEFKEGEIMPSAIWGPNMMIRSKLFHSGHRFNESVGPADGAYIMGSETEFTTRLNNIGHRCYFASSAIVKHIIRPYQMERQWIIKRAFRFGKGVRYSNSFEMNKNIIQRILGIEPWQLRTLIESLFTAAILRVMFLKEKSFKHEWNIYYIGGQIYQHFRS